MTTATITPQPAKHWPFQPGEVVYYEPSNHSMTRPYLGELVPATVVDYCYDRVRIQRADKAQVTMVCPGSLAYRGYCPHCAQPAVALPNQALICPLCDAPALAEPPPDRLVLRLFPLDAWDYPMTVRRAFENPKLRYRAARSMAQDLIEATYQGMLERLQLTVPPVRSSDNAEDWVAHYSGVRRLKFYAMLDDVAGFQAAHQELAAQAGASRMGLREVFAALFADALPPPRAVVVDLPPLPARSADDSEPDGADDLTRWLEAQFRRAA